MYSVFLNGKGGKGVATTVGVFLALAPGPLFWAIVVFIAVIIVSGYSSMGSLCLATALPVFMLASGHFSLIILALLLMALVFWKHHDNIQRLRAGNEHSWKKKQE
jgi:glycerol-3-phosphate acyltransferase PlsY